VAKDGCPGSPSALRDLDSLRLGAMAEPEVLRAGLAGTGGDAAERRRL